MNEIKSMIISEIIKMFYILTLFKRKFIFNFNIQPRVGYGISFKRY